MVVESSDQPQIPQSDFDALAWMTNFSTIIAKDPTAAGVTRKDSAELVALTSAFEKALNVANYEYTRTSETIAHKDEARAKVIKAFRRFARAIQANPNVPTKIKLSLGLQEKERSQRK